MARGPCLAPGPGFNPQIHRRKAAGGHRAGSSPEQRSEWELGPTLTELEGVGPSRAGSLCVDGEMGEEAAESGRILCGVGESRT